MPRISQFYGIAIYQYYRDHPPPHFHAMHGDFEAVVPRPDLEPEGVCALYVRELAPRIEELLDAGERSIKSLLDRSFVRYVGSDELRAVDPELRSFRNINTAADYENWLRIQPDLR